MKQLKLFLFASLLVIGTAVPRAFAWTLVDVEVYGIHLFFDERESVDVLTIKYTEDGRVTGLMHVPNDFSRHVENLKIDGRGISFDLRVPKSTARPKELVYRYEGRFFDSSKRQMIGFVTLKDDGRFVASFVGFRR